MAYKALKGKRMRVHLTNGLETLEMKGVQAFAYRANANREAYGEYGSDGEVFSVHNFENVTGTLDVKDLNEQELVQARSLITGGSSSSIVGIDSAKSKELWMWKNNYDPDDENMQRILSSDLIKCARFEEDYKSELNSVPTRTFNFTALRGINFPSHAICFSTWTGAAGTLSFDNTAVAYENQAALKNSSSSGFVLALFINGELATDKVLSSTSTGCTLVDQEGYDATDDICALTLYDASAL